MSRRNYSKTRISFEIMEMSTTPSPPATPHSPGESSASTVPQPRRREEQTIDDIVLSAFNKRFLADMNNL